MTRTKGSKDRHKRTRKTYIELGKPYNHLVIASFRISKDTWSKFKLLYPDRTSLLIRTYVEGIVKDATE
jgi:hypothetical protein